MIDFQLFNAEFNVTYLSLFSTSGIERYVVATDTCNNISSAEKAGAQAASARSRNCKDIHITEPIFLL